MKYREIMVNRFKEAKEMKQIKKMHVPKYILNAKRKKHIQTQSKYKKDQNMRIYNSEVYEQPEPERKRKIEKLE